MTRPSAPSADAKSAAVAMLSYRTASGETPTRRPVPAAGTGSARDGAVSLEHAAGTAPASATASPTVTVRADPDEADRIDADASTDGARVPSAAGSRPPT